MKNKPKQSVLMLVIILMIINLSNSCDSKAVKTDFSIKPSKKEKKNTKIRYPKIFREGILPVKLKSEVGHYTMTFQKRLNIDTSKFTEDAYFLSFYMENENTTAVIGKHPFVFDMFPTILYDKIDSTYGYIGYTEFRGVPLIIYDTKSKLGRNYYYEDSLLDIPEQYFADDSKMYNSYFTPYWKFELTDDGIKQIIISDTIVFR